TWPDTTIHGYSFRDDVGSANFEADTIYYALAIPNECNYNTVFQWTRVDVSSLHAAARDILTLSQNSPNPFSTSTFFDYNLPADQLVVIELFDLLGNRVRTLVNEVEQAGMHQYKLDATGLAAGQYEYRLRTADGS